MADLEALGATVTAAAEDTGLGWTRMADPEGNDFCAFVRPPERLPAYRLHGIGIDCRDAEAQARWWGGLFGSEPAYDAEHDVWTLTGVAVDETMTLDFAPVPEPRTEPNRLHWDVQGEVDDLLARGATHLWDTPTWVTSGRSRGQRVLRLHASLTAVEACCWVSEGAGAAPGPCATALLILAWLCGLRASS